MSLLLEALKKAEKAKEDAQRRADAGSEAERTELSLQEDTAPAADKKPLMTRDKLPDISSPLEIVSDDLAPPAAAAAPEPEPAPAAQPRRRAAASAPAPSDPQAGERAAGRKVFEAKFKEPNPRLPFYITMAGLGAFAVGTVVYFYLQLRPPPPLVNANPPRQANEAAPPPVAEMKPAGAPAAKGEAPIPGLPGAPSPARAAPAAAAPAPAAAAPTAVAAAPRPPATASRAPAAPESPRLKPQPARVQAAEAPRASPPPAREPQAQVHPRVESGYAAFLAGDAAAARREYQQALDADPANRDALLGMAALDIRAGRHELAEAAYLRLLASDPRDSSAHAALIALRTGRMDPLVAESRLKSMLAAEPGAYPLNFTLGNQYAQQGRWAEAQQEYFKAAAAEPDNPDFAYNLAVSLDQLRQPRLALEHYRRAIALAEKRGAGFDLAAARARAAQLAK